MTIKGDPFRREYGTLTDIQKRDVQVIKTEYENVWEGLLHMEERYGPSRDLSLAKTALQESSMWATRAITKTEGQE